MRPSGPISWLYPTLKLWVPVTYDILASNTFRVLSCRWLSSDPQHVHPVSYAHCGSMCRCVSVFRVWVYHPGVPRSFSTPGAGPPCQSNAAIEKPASNSNLLVSVDVHLRL